MPPTGHAPWAEVGGRITFGTSRENAWQLIKLPVSILGFIGDSWMWSHTCWPQRDSPVSMVVMHGMVYWVKGAFRRNCRQKYGETFFSPFWFFSVDSRGFGDFSSGIFGLGGPGTLGHLPLLSILGLKFSMLEGG